MMLMMAIACSLLFHSLWLYVCVGFFFVLYLSIQQSDSIVFDSWIVINVFFFCYFFLHWFFKHRIEFAFFNAKFCSVNIIMVCCLQNSNKYFFPFLYGILEEELDLIISWQLFSNIYTKFVFKQTNKNMEFQWNCENI